MHTHTPLLQLCPLCIRPLVPATTQPITIAPQDTHTLTHTEAQQQRLSLYLLTPSFSSSLSPFSSTGISFWPVDIFSLAAFFVAFVFLRLQHKIPRISLWLLPVFSSFLLLSAFFFSLLTQFVAISIRCPLLPGCQAVRQAI